MLFMHRYQPNQTEIESPLWPWHNMCFDSELCTYNKDLVLIITFLHVMLHVSPLLIPSTTHAHPFLLWWHAGVVSVCDDLTTCAGDLTKLTGMETLCNWYTHSYKKQVKRNKQRGFTSVKLWFELCPKVSFWVWSYYVPPLLICYKNILFDCTLFFACIDWSECLRLTSSFTLWLKLTATLHSWSHSSRFFSLLWRYKL